MAQVIKILYAYPRVIFLKCPTDFKLQFSITQENRAFYNLLGYIFISN